MARLNPHVDYVQELLTLRKIYACVQPQARWSVIAQRLGQSEIGPARLVTVVSAVEALARSLLVQAQSDSAADTFAVYGKHKYKEPHVLIESLLAHLRLPEPHVHFAEDTWPLFKHAVNFRNLVVHECTYLGQDKFPSLIAAAEEILDALIELGGIRVNVHA